MARTDRLPAGSGGLDPLLVRYAAAPEAEAQAVLLRLLREEVEPVVDRVLAAWSAPSDGTPSDLADLRSEALVQLLRRLRALREEPDRAPIADLRGYAATVARNVCREQLRQRNPERDRLRRKLWHLLRSDAGFHLFRDAAGRWLCRITGRPAAEPPQTAEVRRFAADYLDRAPGPVAVADLIADMTRELGAAPVRFEPAEGSLEHLPDGRRDAAAELAGRDLLSALWSEILTLPPRQAAALLLGLRDAEGRSALILLPATGTASLRQIAAALGWSAEDLAGLWSHLPLPDRQIAERLGLTRQQVINLRKSARERLARRMDKRGFVS